MDMGTEDEDEEDGQVSKLEQEEERERRLLNSGSKPAADDPPATQDDLQTISLSRDMIAKHCMAPWFEDYVKGTWVRYLIGSEDNRPVYRLCEIQSLAASLVKPYQVNNQTVNQAFDLKHGKSAKTFPMDKVSNSPVTQREFDRLVKVCETDHVKLPTKSAVEKKRTQMTKLENQIMTESDITNMLQRKRALQSGNKASSGSWILERTRITQARILAVERGDADLIKTLDKKLAEIEANKPRAAAPTDANDISVILAKVNERNRKANMEATRKAEQAESERKRRERRLAASGTATPTLDPSARLKTLPRMFESRSGTPNVNGNGTPLLVPQTSTPRSVSPLPFTATTTSGRAKVDFTTSVLETIEIDLGDF
ncbi:hypothetical protein OF83DRAFT_365195 [Amylostereum chailletii]|nr:hypothetical protein OF83DRAFT_365195 [Amylostereum chailletii]